MAHIIQKAFKGYPFTAHHAQLVRCQKFDIRKRRDNEKTYYKRDAYESGDDMK